MSVATPFYSAGTFVAEASGQDRPEAPSVFDAREVVEQDVRRVARRRGQHARQLVELGFGVHMAGARRPVESQVGLLRRHAGRFEGVDDVDEVEFTTERGDDLGRSGATRLPEHPDARRALDGPEERAQAIDVVLGGAE